MHDEKSRTLVSVLIIAEAGVNHNGDLGTAFKLIDVALEAEVDAVKFQSFRAESLATVAAPKASYQIDKTDRVESQYEMLKSLELSEEMHFELTAYCQKKGIEFLSSPFDTASLQFLVNEIGLRRLKIPSGEITNGPLLLDAARSSCEIILSTGASTLDEIEQALQVLAFGMLSQDTPTTERLKAAWQSEAGRTCVQDQVTILQCTSQYPAPAQEANLLVMDTISAAFGTKVGYSDHTIGINVSIAAVAMGASVIEKHFTLDHNMSGPDHKASIEPAELANLVASVREVESAFGEKSKAPVPSEVFSREVIRKSLVASREVKKGKILDPEDIAVKRPGGGMSPMDYWDVLGRSASVNYNPDDLIAE